MRRLAVGAAVVAVAGSMFVTVGGAADAPATHRLSVTYLGAHPSADEAVYDVFGSSRGAAVQKLTYNSTATGGTSKTTFYDGHGTTVGNETFTLSAPDAEGLVTIAGTGRYVFGTGRYRHIQGRYTFSGILNTNTNTRKLEVTGKQRY